MKLYTEEQVQLAMRLSLLAETTFEEVLKLLTPIELPINSIDELTEIIKKYQDE